MILRQEQKRVKYAALVIVLLVFTVLLIFFFRAVWSVLQIFIIAGLIVLALDWFVEWLVAYRVPR